MADLGRRFQQDDLVCLFKGRLAPAPVDPFDDPGFASHRFCQKPIPLSYVSADGEVVPLVVEK